jgi:hypothetical protein
MNSTNPVVTREIRCIRCQELDNLEHILESLCTFYKNQLDAIEAARNKAEEEYHRMKAEQTKNYNQINDKYISIKKMLDEQRTRLR